MGPLFLGRHENSFILASEFPDDIRDLWYLWYFPKSKDRLANNAFIISACPLRKILTLPHESGLFRGSLAQVSDFQWFTLYVRRIKAFRTIFFNLSFSNM